MLTALSKWVKNLVDKFSMPQTYGSSLEYFIVKNNPKNCSDVDRLTREFQTRHHDYYWSRGL
jgi:hypothetical protein